MKKCSLILLVVCVLCFAGCSKNTPKGVVKTYYKELQSKNYEGAAQYFAESENQETSTAFAGKLKESIEDHGGLKSYQVLGDSICDDSTVVVFTTFSFSDGESGTSDMRVLKKGGDWKIDAMCK